MPMYELLSGARLSPLDGPFEILGDGATLGPAAQNRDNGPPLTPDSPTILPSSAMTTSTHATLGWIQPFGGDPVRGFELFLDSVYVTRVAASATSYAFTSVPNDSLPHVFSVDAVGSYATSARASITLQWNATPVNPPSPPTGLAYSNVTTTGASLAWTETAVASGAPAIASHNVRYANGVLLKAGIAAAGRTTNLTGLTEQTSYNGVYVTRVDVDGRESNASNTVTFTTQGSGGSTVATPVAGMNFRDTAFNARQYSDYRAWRLYNASQADSQSAISDGGPQTILGITDDSFDYSKSPGTAAQVGTAVQQYLVWLYEGTGSASRQNVEAHIGNGNEIDRDLSTGADVPQAYKDQMSAIWDVVTQTLPGGQRRFPKASTWVDMTQNNIRTGGSGPRFKSIARYLHGMACSMYPPGRDISKNQPDTPVFNPYSQYCDPVFAALLDWRTSGGVGGTSLTSQLTMFATWEFGIPVDHAELTGSVPNGDAKASTDFTVRPRYVAGGRDASGNNWVGFLQYVYNKCAAMGVDPREQCYWNMQSNVNIPDLLRSDAPAYTGGAKRNTGVSTETAWHDWTPGSRLADA